MCIRDRASYLETLAGGRMDCGHIEYFMKSFIRLMGTVDEYLLEPSNLVIEMAYIFGDGANWEFVYIPGYGEDFWRQMEKLSEEWLNYVDYSNEKAVLWAYTFYQKVHGLSLIHISRGLKKWLSGAGTMIWKVLSGF